MCRARSACCARAVSGQAAATLLKRVMNSRRCMLCPVRTPLAQLGSLDTLRLGGEREIEPNPGSDADMADVRADVAAGLLDVRSCSNSGHRRSRAPGPLSANKRHEMG